MKDNDQSWKMCKYGGGLQSLFGGDWYQCRNPHILKLGCYPIIKASPDLQKEEPLFEDYPGAALIFPDENFKDIRELGILKTEILERALAGCKHCRFYEAK